MGLLKDIGNVIKTTANNIQKNIEEKKAIENSKRKILETFEINDLKNICKNYGIGEPLSNEENPLDGRRTKIIVTRQHWVNRIVYSLSLDQINAFCDKNRMRVSKIIPIKAMPDEKGEKEMETKTIPPEKEFDKFDEILKDVKENFELEEINNESDFEKQLTQFLKYRYKMSRQVETPKGKIDIVLENMYAIELKIAFGKNLRDLIGQALTYKKVYPNIAIIVADIGQMANSELREYMEDYASHGIRTLVIKGEFRKRKSKSRQIIIKG